MGFFSYLKNKFVSTQKNNLESKVKEEKVLKIDSSQRKKDKLYQDKIIKKTSNVFIEKLEKVFLNSKIIDDKILNEIKTILLSSDVGYLMSEKIVNAMKEDIKKYQITNPNHIKELLADKMFLIYSTDSFLDSSLNLKKNEPNIILISGVNGSGKTTTVAKLANLIKQQGFKIMLIAADTFRAGAVEQLHRWSIDLEVEFYGPKKEEQDPASVVYEALSSKQDQNYVFLIDTAGRLQNKVNLMMELKKIKRIIVEKLNFENVKSFLVLDALIGQNSLIQAKEFNEILDIEGIILTKMDSTSKGGVIFNIKEQLNIPIKFLGVGEKISDLKEFDLEFFIYNLFESFINE